MPNWIAEVTIAEARGNEAPPAPIDQAGVVFGVTSTGTAGLSPLYANVASVAADYGSGPGVTAAQYIIAEYGIPVALYKPPTAAPGTYGTIDLTGFTGTALPAVGATTPLNDFGGYVVFLAGTTAVGVTGATYKTSQDGGRTLSTLRQLGVGDTINIPNPDGTTSGAQIVIGPSTTDDAALNTLINAEFTAANAHFILTTGTVHTSADTADVMSSGTYPSATNTATRIARVNAIRAAYELHRVKGTGATIHINASGDTVDVVTAPVATDDESALALALDIKAKFNLHLAGLTWHTIADATNVVVAPAPSPGSINAGDVIRIPCHAPTWDVTDMDAASSLAAPVGPLVQSTYDFAHVYVAGACAAADAAHVSLMLNNLRTVGKLVDAVIHTRGPNVATSETEAAWGAIIEGDFAAFADDRIEVIEGKPTIVFDPVTAQVWHRTWAYWYFAAMLAKERGTWVGCPNDGGATDPQTGANLVSLYDSTGTLIGHDEGPAGNFTGLGDALGQGNRFTCLVRGATQQTRQRVYTTVPWVAWTSGGRIFTMPQRRIAQAIERAALEITFPQLGGTTFYDTDPATNISTLLPEYQNSIHNTIFSGLTGSQFEDDIENSADDDPSTGLVQVQSVVTVVAGLVSIAAIIAPKVAGKIIAINLTYAAQ